MNSDPEYFRQQAAEEAKRYRELYYQAMAEMQMMKMKLGKDWRSHQIMYLLFLHIVYQQRWTSRLTKYRFSPEIICLYNKSISVFCRLEMFVFPFSSSRIRNHHVVVDKRCKIFPVNKEFLMITVVQLCVFYSLFSLLLFFCGRLSRLMRNIRLAGCFSRLVYSLS